MSGEIHKVEEFVRVKVGDRVRVFQKGHTMPLEKAKELGLVGGAAKAKPAAASPTVKQAAKAKAKPSAKAKPAAEPATAAPDATTEENPEA
ncbi:MAG TPA: hypothetical protein VHD91_08470 [Gaiellaceae bacterium]|jgi:hypothetical protein|nr:hypothetical protein [Gaiellaceae bacterium]